MRKQLYTSFFLVFLCSYFFVSAQQKETDSASVHKKRDFHLIDTSINYEEFFRDFEEFMDSILSPHSYLLFSVSANRGYFNYESERSFDITTMKKITYSPVIGYYHKSGAGISATGYLIHDGENLNFFQGAISPGYDYLKNRNFATGFTYTRFFTKKSLPFYTTPIQNEWYAYFVYRKRALKPFVSVNYGWGSRTDFEERQAFIEDIRLTRRGYMYINTKETVRDFSVLCALRYDLYRLDVLKRNDFIRFSPQLNFTMGTQKFGFNQTSTLYALSLRSANSVLQNTQYFSFEDNLYFQPLSATLMIRGEYSVGKFFVQPQLIFDYYFPAVKKRINTLFAVNTGVLF
ncbi:MAG: hypothetical protein N2747_09000 [Chitinophagaceae bacterium]|nr:hypothetical protein [Chitinophagaceae bacterium]